MNPKDLFSKFAKYGYLDQSDLAKFTELVSNSTKDVFINKFLKHYVGDKIEEHIDIIKDMSTKEHLRASLSPEILFWLIRIKLKQILDEPDLADNDVVELLDQIIKQHIKDPKEIIRKSSKDILDVEPEDKDFEDYSTEINQISALCQQILTLEQKGEENRKQETFEQNDDENQKYKSEDVEQMIRKTLTKDTLEYVEELKEDIQNMPEGVPQYEIRKVQIQLGRIFSESQQEPILSQQAMKKIEKIEVNDPQGKIAKEKILKGQDVRRNCKILRRAVCGLDIFDVKRMIKKGRQLKNITLKQLPSGMKVKVILLFGLSKAGKTTLITRLMGYKMKKMRVAGITTVQPEDPSCVKENHKSLVIGYSNRSTTRYPRIYEIPAECLPKRMAKERNTVYYLMDSAGLEDSAGAEVQSSNRIAMIEFLKEVDKLQIVTVINQKNWGTKGDDIQKLAKTTSNIIKDINGVKESIKFVFNQFDQDFKETFHKNICDLQKNIEEQGQGVIDENFREFFDELKYQTQKHEQMFTVDPITLDPQQFIQKVWNDKQCINDTSACFRTDIGIQPKKEVKKLCERCKREFKKNYDKGDIRAAQFYLNVLEIIDSEPKLQSGAAVDILDMKAMIEDDISKRIKQLKKEFEQLQVSMIKDKKVRDDKLTDLFQQHQTLGKQIDKYNQIQKSQKLEGQFKEILHETLRWYQAKMKEWENPGFGYQDLANTTINGIQFYQKFASKEDTQSLMNYLKKQEKDLMDQMLRQHRQLIEENKIKNTLKVYKTLQGALGKQPDYASFSNQIDSRYQSMKQAIDLIPLDGSHNITYISISANEEKQILQIQAFLKYIRLIKDYPSELISHIKKQIEADYQYIVVQVPKAIMKKFQQMIKETGKEDEQGQETFEMESEVKDQKSTSMKDEKIEEIKNLIRSLKTLEKIETINKYHDNKLSEQFEGLQMIIEKSISRFDKISEAFSNNESNKIKKDVKKMRTQFKQLGNMIKITGSIKLQERFSELKDSLGQSIGSFIAANDISEIIGFRNDGALNRNLEKLKKLNEFKPIANFIGEKSDYKENIEKLIQNIFDRILDPLVSLQKQINRGLFIPKKIVDFQKYSELLKNQVIYKFDSQMLKQIRDQQYNLTTTMNQAYKQLTTKPLEQLRNIFKNNIDLSEQSMSNLQKQITISKVEKYRKSLQLISEIIENDEIKQIYFSDADHIWTQVTDTLRSFKDSVSDKLELNTWEVNALEKLKKIVSPLRSIESRGIFKEEKIFEELNNKIRQKYKDFLQNDKDSMDRLFNEGNEPEKFDAQLFRDVYAKIVNDKTQNGRKNRERLIEHYKSYKKKLQKKLQSLKVQMVNDDERESEKAFQDFFRQLNKYVQNKTTIINKIKGAKELADDMASMNSMTEYAGKRFIEYETAEQVLYMSEQQMKQKLKHIKPIQIQIQQLKSNGTLIKSLEQFLWANNVESLSEFLINKKKDKKTAIDNLKKDNVDENFERIYQSLQKQQKHQIYQNLIKQRSKDIEYACSQYYKDYKKYEQYKTNFKEKIKFYPQEIKIKVQNQLIESLQNLQKKESERYQQLGTSLKLYLELGSQYKKANNQRKIAQISKIYQSNIPKILQSGDHLAYLKNEIVQNASSILDQPQQLKKVLSNIQNKLLCKLASSTQKRSQNILNFYLSNNSFSDDSFIDDISSVKQSNKNNWQSFLIIFQYFESKGQQSNLGAVFTNNKQTIEKMQNRNQEFINKYLQKCQQVIQKFRKLYENALNENQIDKQEVFKHLMSIIEEANIISKYKELKKNGDIKNILSRAKTLSNNMEDKIMTIRKTNFSIISMKKKQFDEKIQEQRIQQFEKNIKTLQILRIPYYNNYPRNQKNKELINIQQFRTKIKNEKQRALKVFKDSLNDLIKNKSDENIDKQILYIPQLFQAISSKPRQYLIDFKTQQQECIKYLEDILEKQKNIARSQTEVLTQNEKSSASSFQNYRNQQQQNKDKQIQRLNKEQESKLEVVNKKYEQLENNCKEEKQKEDNKKKWDTDKKQLKTVYRKKVGQVQQKYQQALKKYNEKNKNDAQDVLDELSECFFLIKKLATIPYISRNANQSIENQLKRINKFSKIMQKLYESLSQSQNAFAGRIIEEFKVFNRFNGLKYQSETKATNSADYVLKEMSSKGVITAEQRQTFLDYFKKFEKMQESWIQKFVDIKDDSVLETLAISIKDDGEEFKKITSSEKQAKPINTLKRVELIAKIFALWSIIASKQQSDEDSEFVICYRAHAAQIICVLIMIGVDQDLGKQVIKCNRLSEVKTGEGKSIVLAVLSIYFALFGFETHCACYSQILSKRDQEQFASLIKRCGVEDLVHYGIFENIIKKVLNQKDDKNQLQSFDSVVKDLLLSKPEKGLMNWLMGKMGFITKFKSYFSSANNPQQKPKKILLIDEIDVLFDKNFYGDTFNQSIEIRDESIRKVFEFIWKNKSNPQLDYEMINNSEEFKELKRKYESIKTILKNQIYGMLAALKTYKNQQYYIIDKKIMYKVEDSLMDVSYRYNTVYAYMQEFLQNNSVSESAYSEHLVISLCVAQFSYACLPEYYYSVVGVTGTLTCLPRYIKEHLNSKYSIKSQQMFPIPSVYGSNTQNRVILSPMSVQRQSLFESVAANARQNFNKERPILIFFRNKAELIQFYNCKYFQDLQEYASYITEENSIFERTQRIKNSSMKKTITLMTSSYIRGIDFKLFNKKAQEAGGFHGIVTYLIASAADYIQATGRVARQGKNGSFIEIYCKDDFEILQLDKNDQNSISKVPKKREQLQEKERQSCQQKLLSSKKKHDETISIFLDENFDQQKLAEYVLKKNKFPQISIKARNVKMVLLVDATISMDRLFAQLKIFLPTIFDHTYETLSEKGKKGNLEIQIVLYRNYNSDIDKILQYSTFDNQGQSLKQFISKSNVCGGWQNEAVEVALQYVNTLQKVDEIILIGDARGNEQRQIAPKRNRYPHFQKARMEKGLYPTNTDIEMTKLIQKKVRVHGFYLYNTPNVRSYFESLSRSSYGESQYINIHDKNSSDRMTQFIVKRALTLIGGGSAQASKELLEAYEKLLNKKLRK